VGAGLVNQLEAEHVGNALTTIQRVCRDAHKLAALVGLDQQGSGAYQPVLAERDQKEVTAGQVRSGDILEVRVERFINKAKAVAQTAQDQDPGRLLVAWDKRANRKCSLNHKVCMPLWCQMLFSCIRVNNGRHCQA
jgi:hypothetical protein